MRITIEIAFEQMDRDGSGTLSICELKVALQNLLPKDNFTWSEISMVMKAFDNDSDREQIKAATILHIVSLCK